MRHQFSGVRGSDWIVVVLRLLKLLFCLLLWSGPAMAGAEATGPVRSDRLEAELVTMAEWATPGATAVLAIRQKIQPGWHTYWRNPGDSGGAPTLSWSLPADITPGEIIWPMPRKQQLHGLMNFGYTDQVVLPVMIEVPATAEPGTTLPIKVKTLFLVCSDKMCVPDELTLALDLKIGRGSAPLDPRNGESIQAAMASSPEQAGIAAHITVGQGQMILTATGGPLKDVAPKWAYFFPFDAGMINHAAPQIGQHGTDGVRLSLTAAEESNNVGGALAGVLATDLGAWEISAAPGPELPGAIGKGALASADLAARQNHDMSGFVHAALFALLGGLILNLMPCVFPILAMKAAALTRSAHHPAEARGDGFAFLGGVLTTFLILAGILLALRAGGQALGWGFQLQSPGVVAGLAILMLAVSLNLSGVYDIGASLQSAGSGPLARLSGAVGAFFTGVLAVVVAAPCTAPFMAFALGAALLMPWPMALAVFLMLGLGLALPHLLISCSPALLARLPRPGAWMETTRNLLAFPMYGATLWLIWVFARQTGADALAALFAATLLLAMSLWLFGAFQKVRAQSLRGTAPGFAAALSLVLALGFAVAAGRSAPIAAVQSVEGSGRLAGQPWSAEAVQAALAEGRPVLVNFTADWCVTCKINERTALSSPKAAAAVQRSNAVYLVADWTRRDDAITAELERHGRSGVPLYLAYRPGQPEPRILPQLLTDKAVIEALKDGDL